MKHSDKVAFIEEYTEKFENAVVAILADYRGLDVDSINGLRRELREHENGEFRVVKNSLCRRILNAQDKDDLAQHFYGPTSVYFGYDDPVGPTKTLVTFAKENKAFDIKAGYYEGEVLDPKQVKILSDMPSKETLQAMLLGVLQAPSRNMVSLLANVPRGLLNVLNAHKEKLENGEAA